MTNRLFVFILLATSIMIFAGALFKIMHWPGANFLLIAGVALEIAVVVIWIKSQRRP